MTYTPTKNGFMCVEDSAKLLRAIFPDYPTLIPCHPAPPLDPIAQSSTDRGN